MKRWRVAPLAGGLELLDWGRASRRRGVWNQESGVCAGVCACACVCVCVCVWTQAADCLPGQRTSGRRGLSQCRPVSVEHSTSPGGGGGRAPANQSKPPVEASVEQRRSRLLRWKPRLGRAFPSRVWVWVLVDGCSCHFPARPCPSIFIPSKSPPCAALCSTPPAFLPSCVRPAKAHA